MKNKFPLGSLTQFIDIGDLDKDAVVERKQYSFELKIDDSEERTIVADVTTSTPDHEGDIVMAGGCNLDVFQKNPAILWAHQYNELPVGKAVQIAVSDDKISMKMKIAETQKGEDIWKLLKGKFLRACSIGFKVDKQLVKGTSAFANYVKEKALDITENVNRIVTDFTLVENSLVPIPCNPLALVQSVSSKSLKISDSTIKELDLDKLVEEKEEDKDEITLEFFLKTKADEKPYPGEHAFRILSPDGFEEFRREDDKLGEGISVIWGLKKVDGELKAELQSIRFDASKFTFEEAKKWIEEHDYKPIESEPAKEEEPEETEEEETEEESKEEKEQFECSCIDCGYKMTSDKHCNELTCPKCGGQMRRAERPGPGQPKSLSGKVIAPPPPPVLKGKILRHGNYDIVQEYKKYKLKKRGRIV